MFKYLSRLFGAVLLAFALVLLEACSKGELPPSISVEDGEPVQAPGGYAAWCEREPELCKR